MKKVFQIIILNCLILIGFNSYAKSQIGIYMTVSDYMHKHLSYGVDSTKIRLNHSVWEMPYITIKDHGKKHRLNKNEVYAYVDNGNEVYRFYNNEEYLIAEAGSINIYLQIERIALGKGYEVKNHFSFSTSPEGAIVPLTMENIQKAYSSNAHFVDLLDQFFSNGDVTAYDKVHGTFKVNYLYAKSLKEE